MLEVAHLGTADDGSTAIQIWQPAEHSAINSLVLARIGGLCGPALNLVKLNDVCLHGPVGEIAKLLGTNVTEAQEASCAAM